jgi:oligopeptide/dipeptide ABC transporter ATP-binding protein
MACVTPLTPASAEGSPLLRLSGLTVSFDTRAGRTLAAQEVALWVARGECLGVVGESGAGKSQLFLAVLGLLAANGHAHGSARFGDTELLTLSPAALDRVRGRGIGMVFQEPMTSLSPHLRIGQQLTETLVRHLKLSGRAARLRALELMQRVQVSDAALRLSQYPHQLSGGMRQRVMIALALAGEPQLLIADEPTTALDVTIQAQILSLLAELKRERAMALILITHDLAAVAAVADRLVVMRAGRVIESGSVAEVLKSPRDPYTRALIAGTLTLEGAAPVPAARPPNGAAAARPGACALSLEGVSVQFQVGHGWLAPRTALTAVHDVSLELLAGGSLGIVGESGCGKSTLARAALALLRTSSGRVVWMGQPLHGLPAHELRALRRDRQIIFQDPLGSLDPRMTVRQIIAEPLLVHERALSGADRERAVAAALAGVALGAQLANHYPHQLSGGQCQRVGIARAMILRPQLLVCDEPLSALDLPTQAQILTLIAELRSSSRLSLLFISHNLALVRRLCERVLVLYLGRMMELAPAALLYDSPRHPYSRELLAAIPSLDPAIASGRLGQVRAGEPPSPLSPPSGCVYRTRCPYAAAVCAERVPVFEEVRPGHRVACHRWRELP